MVVKYESVSRISIWINFHNLIKLFLWLKKIYEEGEAELKDHDHITGKYWGSALALALAPVVFHNLLNYDPHLIFQEVGK